LVLSNPKDLEAERVEVGLAKKVYEFRDAWRNLRSEGSAIRLP
jgi:hypothetical protein